jgi:hypothetical protein
MVALSSRAVTSRSLRKTAWRSFPRCVTCYALKKDKQMNDPAARCGVSSSVLARHAVFDTPAPYSIRPAPYLIRGGNLVGPCWIPAPAPDSDPGSAGMTNSRQAAGNEPPVDSMGTNEPRETVGIANDGKPSRMIALGWPRLPVRIRMQTGIRRGIVMIGCVVRSGRPDKE